MRCSGGHPPTSQGHNLSSDTTCNLTQTTDKPGVDPMLGPLAANGGPTKTYAPLAKSPALNAGDGTGLEANDQRGAARIQFAVVDIGAIEVSEPMVSTQPAAQTVAEGNMFTLSVAAMNQNSTTPLTYQWRKDGAAIAGATSATFTNPAAAVADAGMYDVMVINDGGGLPSMAVAVTVTPAPKGDDPSDGGGGGGCCSSAGGGAAWPDAVLGLGLVALLGVPRRRRATMNSRR
jgi:MYXO-CTERM domain-containing protein